MKKLLLTLAVGLFLMGTASTASAVYLAPGSNIAPLGLSSPGGTFLTSATSTFSGTDSLNNIWFTGSLTQTVRSNTTGLLFEYIFSNDTTSKQNISQVSITNYGSYKTWVDAQTTPLSPSFFLIGRDSGMGESVTLYGLLDPVHPGDNSGTFWVQTDAKFYGAGSTQFMGTGIATVPTLGPLATPEPATAALFGTGLLGLLGFRRKRMI